MRAIETYKFKTTDGEEREFLLTMGGIKRLLGRFKVANLRDLMAKDVAELAGPVLYEALLNKPAGLTEDGFADLLPAYFEDMSGAMLALMGASMPVPPNPTPTETATTQ